MPLAAQAENTITETDSVDQLVGAQHPYRMLRKLLDFNDIVKSVKIKTFELEAEGFGKPRLIKCLILQFMEDLSDREFERFIAENTAAKWFCDFSLLDKTSDFSTICNFARVSEHSRWVIYFRKSNVKCS